MDIEKQVFTIFSSFIRNLSKTFPEIKNCLYRNYESEITGENLKLSDCPKIQSFLDKVHENNELIRKKDEKLFTEDIEFLEEISFQRLWNKNITEKTKESIWKYFKSFTIITINLNSSKELKEVLETIGNEDEVSKEDIKDKQTAKTLKDLKKLSEEVKEEVTEEDEIDLENMLGGLMDTNIGSIAKEVATSINIQDMFGNVDENTNPMEMMAQMMNPEKMGSIFQNINNVMEKKMESGELDQEILKKEAQDMYGNMADNPLFSNLMGQMNQEQGEKKESPKKEQGPSKKEKTPSKKEQEPSKKEKKEKIKKKIEDKKKERSK